MATLTYTAYVTRNAIKYGAVGLGVFTVLWISISAGIAAWKIAHPVVIPPDLKYGILPKTVFPEKEFVKKSFTQQFPNDNYPKFDTQARTYFIARSISTFLALEEDKKTASQLGFNAEPKELTPGKGVYEFRNDIYNQTLTMNIADGSFKLKYPYETDQLLLNPTSIPNKTEAIDAAKQYLSSADKYPKDLDDGEKKVSFWKIELDGLKAVNSQSGGNAVRVDFYRSNLDGGFPMVSSEYNGAPVSVLISGSQTEGKKIIEVNYKYAPVDRQSFATYPIKTAEAAWDDLMSGNYWPINDVSGSSIIIRKMYLAYFEPVVLTNYLQPVYVFEGDNNFIAYVPAIVDKYVK
ncbi:MAG: hypothetical protein NTY75_01590 [Candidatus Shapirobacteria bacterium]|nr:hypothetical protein [Candidatus Shapirobacteria bacterium]